MKRRNPCSEICLRPDPLRRLPLSVALGIIADIELQAGHTAAAERLAHEAEALRLTGGDRQDRRVPR